MCIFSHVIHLAIIRLTCRDNTKMNAWSHGWQGSVGSCTSQSRSFIAWNIIHIYTITILVHPSIALLGCHSSTQCYTVVIVVVTTTPKRCHAEGSAPVSRYYRHVNRLSMVIVSLSAPFWVLLLQSMEPICAWFWPGIACIYTNIKFCCSQFTNYLIYILFSKFM